MFLIANSVGAGMLLIAMFVMGICVVIVSYTHKPFGFPMILAMGCLTLFIIDLGYRLYRKRNEKWFYENASGGNLFFLPAWAFGLIVFVIAVVRMIIQIRSLR